MWGIKKEKKNESTAHQDEEKKGISGAFRFSCLESREIIKGEKCKFHF